MLAIIFKHPNRLFLRIWRMFFDTCTASIGRKRWPCGAVLPGRCRYSGFRRRRSRLGKSIRFMWLVCIVIWSLLFICCISIYYTDPQRYEYSVPDTCVDESCYIVSPLDETRLTPELLMIVIHASVTGAKRREAIRSTWLKEVINSDTSTVQYRFLLGGLDVSRDKLQQLQLESEKHGDLILLPTVTDSRSSLTQRTIQGFKYVFEHYRFDYVLKCDDDSYVDVFRVASVLHRRSSKDLLYWGGFYGRGRVLYLGAYRETCWSICKRYVPYAYGGGYVLSRDLVQLLVENESHLKLYKNEDVSVGAWLSPYNIERKHDARFNTKGFSSGCKWPYLLSHKLSSGDMYSLHHSLTIEGTFCSWRTYFHRYHGYLYNWTAPPSYCCRTNNDVP